MFSSHQVDPIQLSSQNFLLSSIQRAKDRINSQGRRQSANNDQNCSLNANRSYKNNQTFDSKPVPAKQKIQRPEFTKTRLSNSRSTEGKHIVANAIKVLQDKIAQLESKNKLLQTKMNQSQVVVQSVNTFETDRKIDEQYKNLLFQQQKEISQRESTESKYWLLKQECQSLQKQNENLNNELLSKKQEGKRLNFHRLQMHNQVQCSSNRLASKKDKMTLQEKLILQKKIQQLQNEVQRYKQNDLNLKQLIQSQKKKSFAILKLHKEEILKCEELSQKINQKDAMINDMKRCINRQKLSLNKNRLQPQMKNVSLNLIRKKNIALSTKNQQLAQQLNYEKKYSIDKERQLQQLERKYGELKNVLLDISRDLNRYHPEVISQNIKFLLEKVKKIDKEKRSYGRQSKQSFLKSRSNNLMRFSVSNNRQALSGLRSRSGKKGLKMEDLNSSKKSNSRERTHSKNSNRSNRSQYRSPYAQSNQRNRIRSTLSPSTGNRRDFIVQNNDRKVVEIQKKLKQIKTLSKQIKAVKMEQRNMIIKLNQADKNNQSYRQNQQRYNQLTQTYVQLDAQIEIHRAQKDKLASQTVPDSLY